MRKITVDRHLITAFRLASIPAAALIFSGCGGSSGSGTTSSSPYAITEIQPLSGDTDSSAAAINNNNQVIGYSGKFVGENSYHHGVLWQNGAATSLGFYSTAINNHGDITGGSYDPAHEGQAVIWSGGKISYIGTLDQVNKSAEGRSINDSQQIVGDSNSVDTGTTSFLYTNGSMQDIGKTIDPGSFSIALGINNAGQITGYSGSPGGFIYQAGKTTHIPSSGYAINQNGDVACVSAIWKAGALVTTGFLSGSGILFPNAININDDVVGNTGSMLPGASVVARASLWHQDKQIDLNTVIPTNSGWVLQVAYGINDAGVIVGQGVHNGKQRGFILTPNK